MRVFTAPGATHYCGQFQPTPTTSSGSADDFVRRRWGNRGLIAEGTSGFDEYRTLALRDTERYLFLAASHYRRALDLMVSSASHWAHVTLYYGAWYAANALLGLFGCRIYGDHVVDVVSSQAGRQQLERRRIGNGRAQYALTRNGSHQRFWEAFYKAALRIRRIANPQYLPVLTPVSNDVIWLIKQRNLVNYTAEQSVAFAASFAAGFSRDNFPSSLPGALHTQYAVCEGLLDVTYAFSTQFGLTTDALDTIGNPGPFSGKVTDAIYDVSVPKLVDQSAGHEIFGIRRRPPLLL